MGTHWWWWLGVGVVLVSVGQLGWDAAQPRTTVGQSRRSARKKGPGWLRQPQGNYRMDDASSMTPWTTRPRNTVVPTRPPSTPERATARWREYCAGGHHLTTPWSSRPLRCLESDQIWVLCIGSSAHTQLLEAQRRTLGTQLRLEVVDEASLDRADASTEVSGLRPISTGLCGGSVSRRRGGVAEASANFTNGGCVGRVGDAAPAGLGKRNNAAAGWWCAQKRLIGAVARLLGNNRNDSLLPAFLLVIDDDTFVNVNLLVSTLRGLDPERKLYGGKLSRPARADKDGRAGLQHVLGGAGHVLSRGSLRALRGSIDQCVANVRVDGRWCDWHSDWTFATCAELAGIGLTNLARRTKPYGETFEQSLGSSCNADQVTCHADGKHRRVNAQMLYSFAAQFYGLPLPVSLLSSTPPVPPTSASALSTASSAPNIAAAVALSLSHPPEPACTFPTPMGASSLGLGLTLETVLGGGHTKRPPAADVAVGERARQAYRNVTRQAARRAWFRDKYGPPEHRAATDPVMVLMVDGGRFGDMALNWLCVAEAHNITGFGRRGNGSAAATPPHTLLIFAIDSTTERRAAAVGVPTVPLTEYGVRPPPGRVASSIKRYLSLLLCDLVAAGYPALFVDADAVLLQDPRPLFKPEPGPHLLSPDRNQKWRGRPANGAPADITAQHEPGWSEHSPANTGVVLYRPTCRTMLVLQTLVNTIEAVAEDQMYFNRLMQHPQLARVQTALFNNGMVDSMKWATKGQTLIETNVLLRPTLRVLHVQVGSKTKVTHLKQLGVWLIDPDRRFNGTCKTKTLP